MIAPFIFINMNKEIETIVGCFEETKQLVLKDLQKHVKTHQDKIDFMKICFDERLFPSSEEEFVPDSFVDILDNYRGIFYNGGETLSWINLLEMIKAYIKFPENNKTYFPVEWDKLSDTELYNKSIDKLYQFMLDEKISGFTTYI